MAISARASAREVLRSLRMIRHPLRYPAALHTPTSSGVITTASGARVAPAQGAPRPRRRPLDRSVRAASVTIQTNAVVQALVPAAVDKRCRRKRVAVRFRNVSRRRCLARGGGRTDPSFEPHALNGKNDDRAHPMRHAMSSARSRWCFHACQFVTFFKSLSDFLNFPMVTLG